MMQQGIKGVFQGIAPICSNATIIVTNFEREATEEGHVYHLREFIDETTKVIYREDPEDNTWANGPCVDCLGAGSILF